MFSLCPEQQISVPGVKPGPGTTKNNNMKPVSRIAFKDISQELGTDNLHGNMDNFAVTPSYLDTKKSRRLNKELGVTSLNYLGNTNGSKS